MKEPGYGPYGEHVYHTRVEYDTHYETYMTYEVVHLTKLIYNADVVTRTEYDTIVVTETIYETVSHFYLRRISILWPLPSHQFMINTG